MIYLLADDFQGPERLAGLKAAFSPPEFLELNTANLDGQKLTLRELAEACEAMPFLAEKRLVIVRRLATRFDPKPQDSEGGDESAQRSKGRKAEAEAFCAYLAQVPASTDLVLLEPGPVQGRNPFIKAVKDAGGEVVEQPAFRPGDLEVWIERRVAARGGKMSANAVAELAAFGGNNLRALDCEIEKLVVFAKGEVISENDVALLVSFAREVSVFGLVDALGLRNTRAALRLLHELLADGEHPGRLLAMIIRQFRLLLQLSELRGTGRSRQEMASELHINAYVLPRMLDQVARFTPRQLEAIFHRLVETDLAIKTGRADPVLALDMLATELASVR